MIEQCINSLTCKTGRCALLPNVSSVPEVRTLLLSAYGVCIEVRVPAAVWAEMRKPIIPGAKLHAEGFPDVVISAYTVRSEDGSLAYYLEKDGELLGIEGSSRAAARAIESHSHYSVAEAADGLIFVHAGVVAWKDRAIVIPGPSLTGKSTLTLELVGAGATYYSDEYAVFDQDGRIHPFCRVPRLRDTSGGRLGSRPLESILNEPAPAPVCTGLILMSRYDSNGTWKTGELTKGETLLGLLSNTVSVRRQPDKSITSLAKAIAGANGFVCVRGEAALVVQKILELAEQS